MMGFRYELQEFPKQPGVSIANLSFDPQGRMHVLTQGRVRRWWQARNGWTHYVGHHTFAYDDSRIHRALVQ